MAITYTDLPTLIKDTVQSAETTFVTHIPDFVKAAESDIYLSVQIPDLRKNSTGSCTASNKYLSTPSDFISTYSLAVIASSTHYYLLNKEVDFIREAYPTAATTGRPRFYAQWDDDTFILAPTPDDGYTMELHYFYRPDSIVTTTSSWLGTNAPNALIYGSLLHAYVYLKGEQDMISYYKAEFDKAVEDLKITCEGRNRKDTYRVQNTRVTV